MSYHLTSPRMAIIIKKKKTQKINAGEMWREGNSPTLLVGTFIGTATMENGMKVKVKVAHLCPTLCDPMDCIDCIFWPELSRPKILEWVAFPFSRGSSHPRDQIQVSRIAGRFFTSWATRKAQEYGVGSLSLLQWILLTPGIEPGSPALPADSLPTELLGKQRTV